MLKKKKEKLFQINSSQSPKVEWVLRYLDYFFNELFLEEKYQEDHICTHEPKKCQFRRKASLFQKEGVLLSAGRFGTSCPRSLICASDFWLISFRLSFSDFSSPIFPRNISLSALA
jgi:hypothetical protein